MTAGAEFILARGGTAAIGSQSAGKFRRKDYYRLLTLIQFHRVIYHIARIFVHLVLFILIRRCFSVLFLNKPLFLLFTSHSLLNIAEMLAFELLVGTEDGLCFLLVVDPQHEGVLGGGQQLYF